ncbi:hypothetical protein RB600_006858 [Gaeumannomyces tritici]
MSVLSQDTATTEASSSTKSRVMDRERQKLVDEIKDHLGSCVKSYDLGDFAGSFVPDSDMQRIWTDDRIRSLFAVAGPPLGGNGLGGFQLTHLRSKALPLLSFAASIRRSLDWFLETFPRLVFTSNGWPRTETNIQFPLSSSDLNTLLGEKLSTEDFNLHLRFAPRVTLKLGAHAESVLEVQTRDALPLETQSGRAPPREDGSYGTVYLCRIIPEYAEEYSDHDSEVSRPLKPRPVAVKVFHEKELAKRELENLKLLKRIASNPLGRHRITLHHTIVQHTEGRETEDLPTPLIIFPFADLGNLLQFLDSSSALGDVNGLFRSRTFDERFPHFPPPPTPPHDTARFRRASELLLPQCIALAEALRFLHSDIYESGQVYLVAHMDIKPDNILISSCRDHHVGLWKLADFGISAIHSHSLDHSYDWNRTIGTLARRGPSTHQAPEIERSLASKRLPKEDQVRVGRKGDIWSFGAILAEVLAFAEAGTKGVKKFERMRIRKTLIGDQDFRNDDFWYTLPSGSACLRPTVGHWLEQVKGRYPTSTPWIECIKDTLVVDPQARPNAEQLAQCVRGVLYPQPSANPAHQSPAQPAAPSYDHFPISPPSEQALNSSQGMPNTPQPSYPPQSRNPSVRADPEPQPQPRPAQHSDRSQTSSIAASSLSAPRPFGDLCCRPYPKTLRKPVTTKVIAVSMDSLRVAYLTETTMDVINIQPDSPAAEAPDSPPYPLKLPEKKGFERKWKGLAVGKHHIAIYGVEKPKGILSGFMKPATRSPLLLVLPLPRHPHNHLAQGAWVELGSGTQAIQHLDYKKRVSVSPKGLVALISYNAREVLIFDVNNPTRDALRLEPDRPGPGLGDVAFSEDGLRLYASGVGAACALFVYADGSEQDGGGATMLVQTGSAAWPLTDKTIRQFNSGTLAIPDSGGAGCFVATKDLTKLFGSPTALGGGGGSSSNSNSASRIRSSTSSRATSLGGLDPALQPLVLPDAARCRLRALCGYGGRLLTVDESGQVHEYPVGRPQDGSAGALHLGKSRPICSFDKRPKPGARLGAYWYRDAGLGLVVLCHVDGAVEAFKFTQP